MKNSEARLLTYGIALGAGLMFVLDPRQGGARRAFVRDKSLRALHDVEAAAAVGSRDMAHRLEGVVARARRARRRDDANNDVLASRVRSKLGHVCSHPHAIQVLVKENGCVGLKGPIVAREAQHVLSAISRVRGVRGIDDALERHAHAGASPALQGEPARHAGSSRLWSPALRLVLGVGAGTVAVVSVLRGHPLGLLAGGACTLVLSRSSTRGHPRMLGRATRESAAERPRGTQEAHPPRYPVSRSDGPTPAR